MADTKLHRSQLVRGQIAISGVVACVPKHRIANESYIDQFGVAAEQIIKMTGVQSRPVVKNSTATSDLCEAAARELLASNAPGCDEIDALLFVSQTPDYRLPATACRLQDSLGLRSGIIAFDINLGCSGYPYALALASMMIGSGAARSVLLLVGDTISRIVSPDDRATAMLFGDCGTATLVTSGESKSLFVLGTDGRGAPNLIVPSGAFRAEGPDPRNSNPTDTLFMDGSEIFNFTLSAVPALFEQLCEESGHVVDDFDAILFHQANAFMINHLRKKIKARPEVVPMNIERFGNTSSATIPLLLATECSKLVSSATPACIAMLGFGVGYSWAGAVMELGGLKIARLIEHDF
jgi:3-oxoacyl-[acyl-carrier-protein] synthase III